MTPPVYRCGMSDFLARIERDQGPPLESVKVSLHEADFGAWRGYFFCATRDHFRVGEILRLTFAEGRRKTAVVYGTESVAGRQMWVVDLVGADPPPKSTVEDEASPEPSAGSA
jgi:hypothetical protein